MGVEKGSYREISKTPQAAFPWERRTAAKRHRHGFGPLWESFLRVGIRSLPPIRSGTGKRLVKTPKVYFADVGTLCYLAGLKDAKHAMSGPMGAAIFETAVLGEMARRLSGRGEQPQLYFWRTSAGVEVDLVVETAGKLFPIEVKSSATPDRSMARNIESLRKDLRVTIPEGRYT